jgi:hypothetical protein
MEGLCSLNQPSDPFLQIEIALFLSLVLFVLAIVAVFFLLRLRRMLFRRGYSPGFGSLGDALQHLHSLGLPQIGYVMQQQMKEESDNDDEGGPETAGRY